MTRRKGQSVLRIVRSTSQSASCSRLVDAGKHDNLKKLHVIFTHSLLSLTSVDWELCRGLHPLCPADCLDIQDPVCDANGKIHPNKCVMHNRNCGIKISERPIIFCLGSHRSMSCTIFQNTFSFVFC